jgi:phosphopantothenoylcysteine decarboxylase / phosphopantothenate---cysteine ligase
MILNFLITAGPTREYLDPVRYMSNASSGRMGYALAAAAKRRGHKVVLISGPVELKSPCGIRAIKVVSAREMFKSFKKNYSKADIVIGASAVSDYRPQEYKKEKLKRASKPVNVRFVPNPDIMKYAGSNKGKKLLIGFALETHDLLKSARAKLDKKKFDMIIANYPEVIGKNKAAVWILDKNSNIVSIPETEKYTIAKRIIDEALEIWKAGHVGKKLSR